MSKAFRPARDVRDVKPLDRAPQFIHEYTRKTGRRWIGLRYQNALDRHLIGRFGSAYHPGQWFEFWDGATAERRWCQPDGILVEPRRGRITVIEIKWSHTALAYLQLFDLYVPVLEAIFPPQLWTFAAIEICARFDPAVELPVRPLMRKELLDAQPKAFNVHLWRPEKTL